MLSILCEILTGPLGTVKYKLGSGQFQDDSFLRLFPLSTLIAYKEAEFEQESRANLINMYHSEKCRTGQIGIVLPLRHKQTNRSILVAGTHLVFNPYRGDWKMKQLVHLLATINHEKNRLNEKCQIKDPLVFLCGDLNGKFSKSCQQK